MSQFDQQQPNFFEDSYGQVAYIPSHIFEEVIDPLFNTEVTDQPETNSRKKQTKKREHTAPKVLYALLHKILYWQQDTTSKFKELLRDVNKKHNTSTLLKLIILAKKAGLIPILKNTFPSKAEERLQQLKSDNQWTEERFIIANKEKVKIQKALTCRSLKMIIDTVWFGHNHKGKYMNSIKNVNQFEKMMRKYQKRHLRKSA